MSRLADPTICPDCRGTLDGAGTCRACGLRLQGPVAAELWQTMLGADRLVARLRQQPAPAPAPTPPQYPAHPVAPPPYPTAPAPAPAPAPPRRGLASASVPVVLLSLGGLCLIVFAAIFLGVAWDVLGLWGRSLVMLAITLVLGLSAVLVTRRGLRASAETLWLVVGVMLALDLYAASAADLLVSDLSGRATSSLVGGALLVLGAAAASWGRTTRCGGLVGPQVVAVLGVGALSVAQAFTRDDPAPAVALLVGLLLLVAWLLERLRLPWTAVGTLLLAACYWLFLLALGVTGSSTVLTEDPGVLWWWELALAAAYAVAVVLAPRRLLVSRVGDTAAAAFRSTAAAAALVSLLLILNADLLTDSATAGSLLASLSQLLLVALLAAGPVVWARGAAPLVALGALGLLGRLWFQPGSALLDVLTDATAPAPDQALPPSGDVHPLLWLLHAVVLSLSVAALVGLRGPGLVGVYADGRPRGERVARQELTVASGVAALAVGGWSAVLATGPLLWAAVLAGLLAAVATGWAAWWFRQRLLPALVASAATVWVGGLVAWLALISDSDLLVAMVLTVLCVPLVAAGVARDRGGAALSGAALLGAAALVGAGALLSWGSWVGADDDLQALLLAGYAAVLLLLARPAATQPAGRLVLELAAVPSALAALLVGEDAALGSLVLTVLATALAVSGSWQRDRRALGWVAAGVAVLALLWRGVAGLDVPELASLPAGVVLLVAGALRLHRDPGLSSTSALGAGLALSLVPSLLLSLADPVSLRGALVAAASVALLAVGVLRRLSAPFVLGAVATGLLVLRHLGPVADAVPRWMVIGLVGAVLLVAGITWESGLRNLARARRYVVSLR